MSASAIYVRGDTVYAWNGERGKVLSVSVHDETCWHAEVLWDSGETTTETFGDLLCHRPKWVKA